MIDLLKKSLNLGFGSLLGRIVGFFRYQVIIVLIGINSTTDDVIFFYTMLWFSFSFVILPVMSGSLIADLNEIEDFEKVISNYISEIIIYAITILIISLVIKIGFNPPQLPAYDILLIIIFSLFLLGFNEAISLYNQYMDRYFLYSINPLIWNTVMIMSTYFLYKINYFNTFGYLLLFSISILFSLVLQFKKSKLYILRILKQINFRKIELKPKYYQLTIVLFSSSLFIDFNLFKSVNNPGLISTYSLINKIPELLSSIVSGSLLVVIYNDVIKDKIRVEKGFLKLTAINLLVFLGGGLVIYVYHDFIYGTLFNYNMYPHLNTLSMSFIFYFLFSTLSLIIRLSYVNGLDKVFFFIISPLVLFKIAYFSFNQATIHSILLVNIILYLIISVLILMITFKPYVWNFNNN
ncbi:MAG: hypothetical protein JJ953_14040 [Gracilimonas sp.]|uniref:hypothetical protein n=1 Tax=Gracilimonas sp. TaxID=1974203 RepID=UPI001B0FB2DA|nr:hypothetical protein [Gracilimonas sp.]MBO6587226.1 hypothetical protein [Gracilimonas sp.]MBO6614286.1 hypothetical protein [Gracilimonas sp.]